MPKEETRKMYRFIPNSLGWAEDVQELISSGAGGSGGEITVDLSNYYTKVEVNNKFSQLEAQYVKVNDTTLVKLVNENEINLQEDHYNAWFGYRGGKVTNWKFGDGTEGGLADVYVKDLYLGDEKLSDLLGDKATDADVVHKSGDETIAGKKTFTGGAIELTPRATSDSTVAYLITNSNYTRGENPTTSLHNSFRVNDKNNNIVGEFCVENMENGSNQIQLDVRNTDSNGAQVYSSIYFDINKNGDERNFYPSADNLTNLGTSSKKWKDVNTNLINGETVVTPTYLENKAEEWEFTLSDGSTVTKKIVMA